MQLELALQPHQNKTRSALLELLRVSGHPGERPSRHPVGNRATFHPILTASYGQNYVSKSLWYHYVIDLTTSYFIFLRSVRQIFFRKPPAFSLRRTIWIRQTLAKEQFRLSMSNIQWGIGMNIAIAELFESVVAQAFGILGGHSQHLGKQGHPVPSETTFYDGKTPSTNVLMEYVSKVPSHRQTNQPSLTTSPGSGRGWELRLDVPSSSDPSATAR